MRLTPTIAVAALLLFNPSAASASSSPQYSITVRLLNILLPAIIYNIFQARDAPQGTVQLWSAFNTDLVDHVYSTNSSELDFFKNFYGFSDEGTVTGYLFAEQQPDTVPLFRLYGIGNTDHLYTTDIKERDHAVKRLGYTVVETVGYVYPSDGIGRVPLYRLHNKGVHDHYYTTSVHQRDDAAKNGWTDEGVACYMLPL
jgi:hypothetical protein